MIGTTIQVQIDLDGDRAWDTAGEDVTAYVKSAEWRVGAASPDDQVARANTATVVLDNSGGEFTPGATTALAGFQPGALVRIRISNSIHTNRVMFIGAIAPTGIEPDPDALGPRECAIRCEGWLARAIDKTVTVPLQKDKRPDEILRAIIEATGLYPPGTQDFILDIAPLGNLGSARLSSSGSGGYFAGITDNSIVFSYAGDTWERGASVRRAIGDTLAASLGFFWESEAGQLSYYSRAYFNRARTSTATGLLSPLIGGGKYVYGRELCNDIEVTYRPRALGASYEVLGTMGRALRVPPEGRATATLRYADDRGGQIGGDDVQVPASGTDWTANTGQNGVGTDVTALVSLESYELNARGASLTFVNTAAQTVYVLGPAFASTGAQVRGLKLTAYNQTSVAVEDGDSIFTYGRVPRRVDMAMVDSDLYAQNIADYLIFANKEPSGRWEEIAFNAAYDTNCELGAGLYVSQRVDVAVSYPSSQTISGFIVGTAHRWSGPMEHFVTWVLRQDAATVFFFLSGFGSNCPLGQLTTLA